VTVLLVALLGLAGVAFLTLLERKILGLTQLRLGPNKVTISGILQPLGDGVKLLMKQSLLAFKGSGLILFVSPVLLFRVFLVLWRTIIY
jgi:NADH:ubiquinone oxidoreductase subunit H